MKSYHNQIADLFSKASGIEKENVFDLIEFPPQADQGDRAIACFRFAKQFQKSPQELAAHWAEKIKNLPKEIAKVEVKGAYINFFFDNALLAQNILKTIFENPESFEKIQVDSKRKVVVEFSSPNIAKPFSIGHLRSTNLGACLSRIYSYLGFNVVRINHLGDWGTQFGKLITAYHRWGNAEMLQTEPIQALFELYVKYHDEEKNDPSLNVEARDAFSKLEKGDEKAFELWNWFRDLTLKELDQLYTILGVEFDHLWGESFYIDQMPAVMKALDDHSLSQKSEGAIIVDLKDENLGVAVLQKGDESSLYITRDLAAAIYRHEQFAFEKMVYVVGSEQSLHFQQLFHILGKLGHSFSKNCIHVAFGQITFGNEKMSTRKGNVVFLKDVLSRAQEKALQIVTEKNPDLPNLEQVAGQVALSAILFADISAKRIKNVKFGWDDILSFDGETGPYLQYSYVRTQSLIEKYNQDVTLIDDFGIYQHELENQLIRTLSGFSHALNRVILENEPFYLGQYLIQVTKDFNRFYQACPILKEIPTVQASRMLLVQSTAYVLKTGLGLLGIPTPDKM